jgi:thiol:disulfide interchange protein
MRPVCRWLVMGIHRIVNRRGPSGLLAMRAGMRSVVLTFAVGIALSAVRAKLAEAYYSATWYEDAAGYEKALREQSAHHVPIFVYFRVDWCPHCRAFDDLVEAYEVRSKLNEVIKVRVNPEHGAAEKALEARFGSNSYPALFLQRDGGTATALSAKGPPAHFAAQLPGR